jgi:hypothetical protein
MKRGEVGALLGVAGHPFGLLPPPLLIVASLFFFFFFFLALFHPFLFDKV